LRGYRPLLVSLTGRARATTPADKDGLLQNVSFWSEYHMDPRAVRDGDTVARLGGDEFILILNDQPGQEVIYRRCSAS